MKKAGRRCIIPLCILSFFIHPVAAYVLPSDSGPVSIQFEIICGLPNELVMEATLLPGRTVIVDSLTMDSTSSAASTLYYLNVPLSVGCDSIGFFKNIVHERTIICLPHSVYQQAYSYPSLKLVILRGGEKDTVSDIQRIDGGLVVIYLPPVCNEAVVGNTDSLLRLMKEKYDSSGYVYLLRTIGDTFDRKDVGDESLLHWSFLPWTVFDKHDEIINRRYNFEVIDRLKGSIPLDTCSFLSGHKTYHFVSQNKGNPIYFDDSIKTKGDEVYVNNPGIYGIPLGMYKTWLVFSRDSLVYDRNPGFQYPGSQCPYELCKESGTYVDSATLKPVAYPPRINGIPIPVANDTVYFNALSKVPLQAFLDMLNRNTAALPGQLRDAVRPSIVLKNGRIILTNGRDLKDHVFLSMNSAGGRSLMYRKEIRATGPMDGIRPLPGVYFIKVDCGRSQSTQRIVVIR
jgi:hypothetical protein